VVLDSANDFGGALSITAASATVKDINALDLGAITLSGDLDGDRRRRSLSDSGVIRWVEPSQISAAAKAWCLTAPTTSAAH
jgi:hypothetical protein